MLDMLYNKTMKQKLQSGTDTDGNQTDQYGTDGYTTDETQTSGNKTVIQYNKWTSFLSHLKHTHNFLN